MIMVAPSMFQTDKRREASGYEETRRREDIEKPRRVGPITSVLVDSTERPCRAETTLHGLNLFRPLQQQPQSLGINTSTQALVWLQCSCYFSNGNSACTGLYDDATVRLTVECYVLRTKHNGFSYKLSPWRQCRRSAVIERAIDTKYRYFVEMGRYAQTSPLLQGGVATLKDYVFRRLRIPFPFDREAEATACSTDLMVLELSKLRSCDQR